MRVLSFAQAGLAACVRRVLPANPSPGPAFVRTTMVSRRGRLRPTLSWLRRLPMPLASPLLTDEQREAVRHGGGPALVIGGPGSGKTRTTVARYQHVVRELGLPPAGVVCTTPDRRAAERLRAYLATGESSAEVRPVETCQSLAERFLVEIRTARGEAADLHIVDGRRRQAVLRLLQIDWRHGDALDVLEVIRRRKAELLAPSDWLEILRRRDRSLSGGVAKRWFEACDVYFRYQEYLTAHALLDREDVLLQVVALLRQARSRSLWDRDLTHVIVDDAQHASLAELTFLQLLVGSSGVLWVAADDDQRLEEGAWQPTAHLREVLPALRCYRLTTGHRGATQVVEPALRLIRLNTHRTDKPLRPTRLHGKPPAVITFPDAVDEAAWVVQYLLDAHREGVAYRHLAVLARLPEPLTALHETLATAIPVDRIDVPDAWTHPIGAAYAAFVQIALDVDAGDAMTRVRLSPAARQRCRKAALEARGQPFAQIRIAARNHAAGGLEAGELTASLANELHLLEVVHGAARSFTDGTAFLQHVQERHQGPCGGEAGITLATFAGAAGREWPVVVIIAMEDGQVPYHRGGDLEAERRQLFLGLTRSRQVLNLSLARRRGGLARSPSSFFFDLGASVRRVQPDEGA
ncbi:MAG: ATP-dependent helicase [Geminicoccaceae bacterium]|nr:MAG: ATP-dependent helicase [Geminicoccaceae bacterium]